MSDWYTVSFDFKTDEDPPLDPWELIQWLCRVQPIAYDAISLTKDWEESQADGDYERLRQTGDHLPE